MLLDKLTALYWQPMFEYVQKHPKLIQNLTGFLLYPEQLIVYIGKTHIAIEYSGPERISELVAERNFGVKILDYSSSDNNFVEEIIGFRFDDSTVSTECGLPLLGILEDLVLPTNRGFDKLEDLHWNFAAQDMIIGFNLHAPVLVPEMGARIINALFFDAVEEKLRTRHVKWMDFIPISFNSTDSEDYDTFSFSLHLFKELCELDARYIYPLPDDFRQQKLKIVNRFIELAGGEMTKETDLTRFVEHNDNKYLDC